MTSTSVAVSARHLPARMKNGTPSQRQESMREPQRRERLDRRVGRDARLLPVAAELPAHESAGLQRADRAEQLHLLVADRLLVVAAGGSIASKPTTCSRWFCTTSRMAPASS